MRRDDPGYTRYTTTLRTLNNGTVVGRPGEHPDQVVMARYGSECGYLPWREDGYCGVVVKPATTTVNRVAGLPTLIVTEQEIIDWVMELSQVPEGAKLWP